MLSKAGSYVMFLGKGWKYCKFCWHKCLIISKLKNYFPREYRRQRAVLITVGETRSSPSPSLICSRFIVSHPLSSTMHATCISEAGPAEQATQYYLTKLTHHSVNTFFIFYKSVARRCLFFVRYTDL